MSGVKEKYRMTVALDVLEHLGKGLYSSVAAVLTEAVANAWDADATIVKINVNIKKDTIEIIDNGIGMNQDAINDHYLRVGYKRREESDTTPSGRKVMGRKGIGKLSLYSIANVVKVYSKDSLENYEGLKIVYDDLEKAMKEKKAQYNPEPQDNPNNLPIEKTGTFIQASDLIRKRLKDGDPKSLRRRLARRFSIIGSDNFSVFINDEEVTIDDRDDLKFVEYLWEIEGTKIEESSCRNLKKTSSLLNRDDRWKKDWNVRGWIGTVDTPRRLMTPEGNLNSIVVLSRGRLVDEDILPRIAGAEMYTKYLTGHIEADFLDASYESDIVTSNRQKVVEDDERVEKLIVFMKEELRKIADAWSKLRRADRTEEIFSKYPHLHEWIDNLKPGWKVKAQNLLERIATMEITSEEGEQDEARLTLLRHVIFGFERLRLKESPDDLTSILDGDIQQLLKLLADRDSLEAAFYYDIIQNRLDVIKELEKYVEANEYEKIIQQYLFDHLWLLDPSWEPATQSPEMEKIIRKKEVFRNDEDTKNKYFRIDIYISKVAGKHVIIELKRASVLPKIYELAEQGSNYVTALKDLLPSNEQRYAQIEVIFVVGKQPKEESERIEKTMQSVAPGSRIVTYEALTMSAISAYEEFLTKEKEVDKIEQLFKASN